MRMPGTGSAALQARHLEQTGWDGITFVDSQNLVGDPFVAVALGAAATEHLQFATGVTNAFTRHPAALASVAATVQEESGGRFVLGIGRGDTALFHLGRRPMKVDEFVARVTDLQTYLAGGTVDCDGTASRLLWLARAQQPKVPLDIAASGPRLLDFAGALAERVTLAVGADPERVAWAVDRVRTAARDAGRDPASVSIGAYLNVGCHPDAAVARELIGGGVAAFAHFSAMPGSTGAGLSPQDRAVVAEVGRRYDSHHHLDNRAGHVSVLPAEFVDRFAVVGPPETCALRLRDLADLGIRRMIVTGATIGADPDAARTAHLSFTRDVVPALHQLKTRTA